MMSEHELKKLFHPHLTGKAEQRSQGCFVTVSCVGDHSRERASRSQHFVVKEGSN